MISNAVIQLTAQLEPEQLLEMPINLRTRSVSQKTGSSEFKMRFALLLAHLLKRVVCSVNI